ncbi:pimeloyl-ACP methyl ester carboxylesterase [Paenarthrobacter nitroguajacolicus]|uniref:alpha/beta hydrolase family protein n=1 Tax=Paenarthrobacter nitroguajacolicus TaxID=211146 RepID=UPI0028659CEA|nr:alpha/beta fold hydrolase [Paenarthrobacter nitroguajacolicus]MDR6989293.1 pimeloyl-ACP methyl ester carboxylesterase [Paenarthrobacter nitroguajacolicus]
MSTPITEHADIPVNERKPFLAYSALALNVPGRPVPLELRVSFPATGTKLPILLFSHGHGGTNFLASLHGYGPLVDFFAAHGFAVIQPSHLDAPEYGLREEDLPDRPLFWRDRATDMHYILDHLSEIESAVPGLAGRLDHDKIVTVGHSLGGVTVTSLMGMQVLDPEDARKKDVSDSRITAGVALAPLGIADEFQGAIAKSNYPMTQWINFDNMTGKTLVVSGDEDLNPMFSDRLSYRWDAYTLSPGTNKTLLTFFGARHMLGGISGYDAVETDGEDPFLVATLRALTWAYLWSALYPEDSAWADGVAALEGASHPLGKVETKK